jgi:hypothetical protein
LRLEKNLSPLAKERWREQVESISRPAGREESMARYKPSELRPKVMTNYGGGFSTASLGFLEDEEQFKGMLANLTRHRIAGSKIAEESQPS